MDLHPIRSLGVLVVDESEAFLASVRHWIESRSDVHLAGTARDAASALEAVADLDPDLVIVEALLPGIGGFRLARALKSGANSPTVVIVTFHASAAARDEAMAAGADGFLAKADFSDGLDALLEAWKTGRPDRAGRGTRFRTPARPARRESRTAPDP